MYSKSKVERQVRSAIKLARAVARLQLESRNLCEESGGVLSCDAWRRHDGIMARCQCSIEYLKLVWPVMRDLGAQTWTEERPGEEPDSMFRFEVYVELGGVKFFALASLTELHLAGCFRIPPGEPVPVMEAARRDALIEEALTLEVGRVQADLDPDVAALIGGAGG